MTDVSTTPRKSLSKKAKLKIFEAHAGKCWICGQPIRIVDKWIIEHLRPLSLGGTNDHDNLAPVHLACAEVKTNGKDGDLAKAAKAKRVKMAALGIKRDGPKIQSRGFPVKPRAEKLPLPARRNIYEDVK